MGWSIGVGGAPQEKELDVFFKTVGKALWFAQEYEHKCLYVAQIAKLENKIKNNPSITDFISLLENTQEEKRLHQAIVLLGKEISEDEISLLLKAKDARNFIAHEVAQIGRLYGIRKGNLRQILTEKTDALRAHLKVLVAGDNLVSSWVYFLEESKAGYVPEIAKSYERQITNWIFS